MATVPLAWRVCSFLNLSRRLTTTDQIHGTEVPRSTVCIAGKRRWINITECAIHENYDRIDTSTGQMMGKHGRGTGVELRDVGRMTLQQFSMRDTNSSQGIMPLWTMEAR